MRILSNYSYCNRPTAPRLGGFKFEDSSPFFGEKKFLDCLLMKLEKSL